VELDEAQFERLLQVLSTEPATNMLSAANITAMMSVLIAFILGALAFSEREAKRRARDAEFIFQSEKDYAKLLEHLVAVGDWATSDSVKRQLASVDVLNVSPDGLEILKSVNIPEDIWRHAREIKTHFKAIAKFHRKRIVSKGAIELSLDHWGYRLLMDVVRRMDVHRFYYARQEVPERVTSVEFSSDFAWYADLRKIKDI
jgi:hypothetical protein